MNFLVAVSLFISFAICLGFKPTTLSRRSFPSRITTLQGEAQSRRKFASSTASLFIFSTQCFSPTPALAFQNKLDSKYDDRPRQRGSPPKDLGFKSREVRMRRSISPPLHPPTNQPPPVVASLLMLDLLRGFIQW
jgi:hypothetical protein